jgi:hypothetical protein
MKIERELWEYFMDKKFKIGDIVKVNKKIEYDDNFFYSFKYAIYPPYFNGKIGRIIKIITEQPKYDEKMYSIPINRIIEERLSSFENKLYMVSMIMPLPKTKDFLMEVIGFLTEEEIVFANEKEREIYPHTEENFISQTIAEEI